MWPGIAFSPPTRYASDGTDPAGFARSLTVSSRTTPCDGTSGGSRRDLTVLPHVGFALPILYGGSRVNCEKTSILLTKRESPSSMRALITGGTGFIGSEIARLLISRG